jgi:hypothetical protein
MPGIFSGRFYVAGISWIDPMATSVSEMVPSQFKNMHDQYLAEGVCVMIFHTRLLLVTTAAFALCGLPGVQAQQLSAQDRTFMEDAAKEGIHEIQMGYLGIERGQSQALKGFCQRLINDHTMANHELTALAKQEVACCPEMT